MYRSVYSWDEGTLPRRLALSNAHGPGRRGCVAFEAKQQLCVQPCLELPTTKLQLGRATPSLQLGLGAEKEPGRFWGDKGQRRS